MKKSLLLGALCAAVFCFAAPVARAQAAPVAPVQAATQAGYDALLQARELLQIAGSNGSPSAAEKLTPDENLRRQRLAVARNALALAQLRTALQLGITLPDAQDGDVMGNLVLFASVREMARQLAQEADVRAADGDAMGAAQSGLDALQLGAQISRGPIINGLVGVAISGVGRLAIERNAPQLDAAQSREVARQLDEIGAQMPAFAAILRDEQSTSLTLMQQAFEPLFANLENLQDPAKRAQMEAELQTAIKQGEISATEAQEARAQMAIYAGLTRADFEADMRSIFEQAITRAATPYFAAAQTAPIRAKIPALTPSIEVITAPSARFGYERNALNNRLLAAALRLRATKLETGAYPATFDAGVDPFSPTLAPLIYKRAGDSYVLYSVGPDGVDDDGGEIQALVTNEETGAKTVNSRLQPESLGDIAAPVL